MRVCTLLSLLVLAGCKSAPAEPTQSPSADADVDYEAHAFFDAGGNETSFDAYVDSVADIDFVGFGELHYHAVGSRYELELLKAMSAQPRPVALAMEFFEADTQKALDEYLAGNIDEAEFREQARRDEKYDDSHRPLIEFCKQAGIPVIAANAPRPLVTAYRKAGVASYDEYLTGLTEEERALLPAKSVPPDDEFKERFMEVMGPDRGPRFYKSMALWNDAMAEAAANFRAEHPEHRVLLIVGGFHVAKRLGTVTQYLDRRPDDSASVLLMQVDEEGPIDFTEDDRDEGDVVLKVRMPPAK